MNADEIVRQIAEDSNSIGINKGDTVLIHSSFKSLGETAGGIESLIKGLMRAVGETGTLIFPALSYFYTNPSSPFFDVQKTPSNVGAVSEYFRKKSGVIRSVNPTHSCCAYGDKAMFITASHYIDNTPCGKNSPYHKIMEAYGKILFIGCGLKPNTSMHAVEELVRPPYLFSEGCEYTIRNNNSVYKSVCAGHNFKGVVQRYDKLEMLLNSNELKKGGILNAKCYLMEAQAMWEKGYDALKHDNWFFVEKTEME